MKYLKKFENIDIDDIEDVMDSGYEDNYNIQPVDIQQLVTFKSYVEDILGYKNAPFNTEGYIKINSKLFEWIEILFNEYEPESDEQKQVWYNDISKIFTKFKDWEICVGKYGYNRFWMKNPHGKEFMLYKNKKWYIVDEDKRAEARKRYDELRNEADELERIWDFTR